MFDPELFYTLFVVAAIAMAWGFFLGIEWVDDHTDDNDDNNKI